jgi:hypothetical protein
MAGKPSTFCIKHNIASFNQDLRVTPIKHFKHENKHPLQLKTQSVPRSKHSVSVIKTSQLTLHRKIIAVRSQVHIKHINTLCGQNVQFLNVKPGKIRNNLLTSGINRVRAK